MQATGRSAVSTGDVESLRAEHRELETQLRKLDRHRSLSPEEQYEMQVIKKRKLALKDRIARMK